MQKLPASFGSIDIQANGSSSAAAAPPPHVLSEDELPLSSGLAPSDTVALKGGDGYDRLLEYRCGRYLYNAVQATFLPVPAMPDDFGTTLHAVAGSRNIKGACMRLFPVPRLAGGWCPAALWWEDVPLQGCGSCGGGGSLSHVFPSKHSTDAQCLATVPAAACTRAATALKLLLHMETCCRRLLWPVQAS